MASSSSRLSPAAAPMQTAAGNAQHSLQPGFLYSPEDENKLLFAYVPKSPKLPELTELKPFSPEILSKMTPSSSTLAIGTVSDQLSIQAKLIRKDGSEELADIYIPENHWLYVLAQSISVVAVYALNQYVSEMGLLFNLGLVATTALCSQIALKKIFGNISLKNGLYQLRTPLQFFLSPLANLKIPVYSILQVPNYQLFAAAQGIASVATYALNVYAPGISLLSNLTIMGVTALSSHVVLKLKCDPRPFKAALHSLVSL